MLAKENKITINELPDLSDLDRFNEFLIQIKADDLLPTIDILKASGLEVYENEGRVIVYYVTAYNKHKILELTDNSINIFPPTSRLVPLYFRELDNVFYLTNVVENLIPYESELHVSSFACAVNLSRHWAPYNHFFNDIACLTPLCHYKLVGGELKLLNLMVDRQGATIDETLDVIYEQYDKIFDANNHVFIFITGGFDSRANLALARHFSKKYNNKITLVRCDFLFSGRKNKGESQDHLISTLLAEKCKYDLLNFKVDPLILDEFKKILYTDERFIKMNPTISRPSTAFYYLVFNYIKNNYKDSVIIANQTDCHKGIGYDLVQEIKQDYHLLGAASEKYVKYINNYFGIPYEAGFQNGYVDDVFKRSDKFDLYGQIDYFHYETYNSCIGPARAIWQNLFDTPFPFLDERFIAKIFNLAPEYKKDAFIPKELIRRLSPDLLGSEFNSGSNKMYRKRRKSAEFVEKVFVKMGLIIENVINKNKVISKISNGMVEDTQWAAISFETKNTVIKKMIDYCSIYKRNPKNISVYATQLTAIKLAYIEKNLRAKIIFDSNS